jgi:uncharacterized radical SAM superfamily protein
MDSYPGYGSVELQTHSCIGCLQPRGYMYLKIDKGTGATRIEKRNTVL